MTLFRALYRAVLGLLPVSFRARHGADALSMASARVREDVGLARLARAVVELLDLLASVPRIRRDYTAHAITLTPCHSGGGMLKGLFVDLPYAIVGDLRYATRTLLRSPGFTVTTAG